MITLDRGSGASAAPGSVAVPETLNSLPNRCRVPASTASTSATGASSTIAGSLATPAPLVTTRDSLMAVVAAAPAGEVAEVAVWNGKPITGLMAVSEEIVTGGPSNCVHL